MKIYNIGETVTVTTPSGERYGAVVVGRRDGVAETPYSIYIVRNGDQELLVAYGSEVSDPYSSERREEFAKTIVSGERFDEFGNVR